jgi:hypothetical protein
MIPHGWLSLKIGFAMAFAQSHLIARFFIGLPKKLIPGLG